MPDPDAKERILIVGPTPPTIGGIARWTQGILESDLAEEFAIEVFDTSPPREDSLSGRSRFTFRRALASLIMLVRFSKMTVGRRPRFVHINTSYHWAFPRDGLMVWIAWLFGARTALHLHGGDFEAFYSSCRGPLRAFARRTLQRVDVVISITRDTQDFLRRQLAREDALYLPNFVRLEHFSPRIPEADVQQTARTARPVEVLFVGWIIEEKGVAELLEAARAIPDVRVSLAGPSDPDFLARIDHLLGELQDRVSLLGSLPHAAVVDLYARSDVFALPTHREGFPNVIIEAMASGLPVITTPVGAIPEIIDDEVEGFLVAVGDVETLRDRLERLSGDERLRAWMGERGRRRVCEHFSLERVVRQLSDVYRDVSRIATDSHP